jgi:hypothetical protein
MTQPKLPIDQNELIDIIARLEKMTRDAGNGIDSVVAPVRKTILKRYPFIFALLISLGATAVFLGIEQILLQFDILRTQPWLIVSLGVGILALTGRLYKKLN